MIKFGLEDWIRTSDSLCPRQVLWTRLSYFQIKICPIIINILCRKELENPHISQSLSDLFLIIVIFPAHIYNILIHWLIVNYKKKFYVVRERIELSSIGYQPIALPLSYRTIFYNKILYLPIFDCYIFKDHKKSP